MISVVVPVYNASDTILPLLEALKGQTIKKFEVVCVDDGSTDDSPIKIKNFKGMKIRLFSQENKGPAFARNLGAQKARGDVIVFIDSDCLPRKDWLGKMTAPLKDNAVGVMGVYETHNKESMVARYVGYEIDRRHSGMGNHIDFISTYSAAYRRDIFLKFGGFDTSFRTANAEDTELSYRIRKAGYMLALARDAVVLHRHPSKIRSYLGQQFSRGYWRTLMYAKHPKKFVSDSYTGYEVPVQTVLVFFFFISLIWFFVSINIFLFVASIILLMISNIGYGIYAAKKEPGMLLIAPVFASLRSISGFIGAIFGVREFFR